MKLGLNVVLVLAALVGPSLPARETLLRKDLSREYGVLAAEVGYLESTGEPGVQVIALPTKDPRHFRWRILCLKMRRSFVKLVSRGIGSCPWKDL